MKCEPSVILIVEDNDDHAELLFRCFDHYKIDARIIHLTDGEAAMDYLFGKGDFIDRTLFPLPCFIIMDLRIPKVDGLEVITNIKNSSSHKHIPVVVLTSSENEKDIVSAYDSHANSYLVKPIDYVKFETLIERMKLYWYGPDYKPC